MEEPDAELQQHWVEVKSSKTKMLKNTISVTSIRDDNPLSHLLVKNSEVIKRVRLRHFSGDGREAVEGEPNERELDSRYLEMDDNLIEDLFLEYQFPCFYLLKGVHMIHSRQDCHWENVMTWENISLMHWGQVPDMGTLREPFSGWSFQGEHLKKPTFLNRIFLSKNWTWWWLTF